MTDFECEVKKFQMEERKRKLAEGISQSKQTEIESMKIVVKESVASNENTQKQFKAIMTQRDMVGTQLIRKNDEIGLLYEKIKILQTVIS